MLTEPDLGVKLTEQGLKGRRGPVLSDGTNVADLIDLDKREVSMRVYSDPEIHRLELDRVFAKTWVFVGHECEIPNPDDFVVRTMGADSVIVNRSADGEINILLNICAHRGMGLCFADEGNDSRFRCRFHGWLYDDKGALVAAPFERDMYGDWDKSKLGLRRARVAVNHGMIYGTFSEDAPPFEEYAGEDACWYLDQMYGQNQWRALGPPLRLTVNANWKIFGEQSCGDAYHVPTQHAAIGDLGIMATPTTDAKGWGLLATGVISRENHVFVFDDYRERFAGVKLEDEGAFAPGWIMSSQMFPANFTITAPHPTMTGGIVSQISVNQFVPVGPDKFEVWTLSLVDKDLPEAQSDVISEVSHISLSMTQPDDIDAWEWIQRSATGAVGRVETIKYNTMAEPKRPDDWPGPGTVYSGFLKDNANWQFWLRWLDAMTKPVA